MPYFRNLKSRLENQRPVYGIRLEDGVDFTCVKSVFTCQPCISFVVARYFPVHRTLRVSGFCQLAVKSQLHETRVSL